MKKKYICLLISVFLVFSITILYLKYKNPKRIYLSDKFYNIGEFIDITSSMLDDYKNDTYVLYIYNNFCSFSVPCEDIFKDYMQLYHIDFVSMKFEEFKNTTYHKKIKYAPSIIIINKSQIVAYLNPEKNSDVNKYQNIDEFTSWINKYIYQNK